MERTGWSITPKRFGMRIPKLDLWATTPSAALWWLRGILLMPQPPPLTRRGMSSPFSFITYLPK
jgi:hypothetical protein